MDASTDRRETDSAGVSIPGWRPPCGSTQGLHPSVDGSPELEVHAVTGPDDLAHMCAVAGRRMRQPGRHEFALDELASMAIHRMATGSPQHGNLGSRVSG